MGNCELMVKEIAAAVPGSPKLSMVRLVEKDIRPCKACYRCLTGDCPHQDDFPGVLRAIMEADAVIVAAPAYLRGTHSCLQRFLDRGLQAYRHVDALYGKPAVAVATAGVEDGEGSALLGVENFIRQLGLSLKGRAVVRATFPGDAIVSAEGRSTARRLAAALVSPDDYAPEGVSCPECKGTYFEFRGMNAIYCLSCGGTGTFSVDGGKVGLAIGPPAPLLAEEGGHGVAREMADRPTRRVPSPEGTAEGSRETVPRGGVPLMRKDGRETRQNIIEKSLQIFSVKGYYNTSISDIMAATGLTKGGSTPTSTARRRSGTPRTRGRSRSGEGSSSRGYGRSPTRWTGSRRRSRTTCATTVAGRCSRAAASSSTCSSNSRASPPR